MIKYNLQRRRKEAVPPVKGKETLAACPPKPSCHSREKEAGAHTQNRVEKAQLQVGGGKWEEKKTQVTARANKQLNKQTKNNKML